MIISINHLTKVIFIPKSSLTLVSGVVYELDVDEFRLALKDYEDDEAGMTILDTHRHNSIVSLSGVNYAQTFEVINGYTVEFEDGQYAVTCTGANHNLADVKVPNQVSLIIGNSAGLVVVQSSDLSAAVQDITDSVWNAPIANYSTTGTTGAFIYKKLLTVGKFIGLK